MHLFSKAGRNRLLAAAAGVLLAGSTVAAVSVSSAQGAVDPITIANPGAQLTTPLGSAVSLQITAADTDTAAGLLVYTASGLPTGLAIDGATGLISGTASTVDAGEPVTITVTDDDANEATATFDWTVKNTIVVDSPGTQATPVGQAIAPVTVTGTDNEQLPLTFAATGLPPGLGISPAGVISGTPTTPGTYLAAKVTASDGTGSPAGTVTFTWKVGNIVTVTAPATETSQVGKKIAPVTVKSADTTAGLTYTYSATNLPPGLTLNAATGVISGTPTVAQTYTTVVTSTDSTNAAGTATITWTVGKQNTVKVSVAAAKTVYLGVKVTVKLAVTDSDKSIKTFAYSSSALPRGLILNKSTGVISGRPTNAGTKKTTFAVKDPDGAVGTAVVTFTIKGAVAVVDLQPTVKSTVVGSGLYIQFTAKDAVKGDTMSFSATGLPPGMRLSMSPLMLWGWPTTAGTYHAEVHEKGKLGSSAITKVPLTVSAANGTGPKDQVKLADGKCLQAPKGAKVQLATCVSSATENWTLATDGTIRANGACLVISGSSTYKGKVVELAHCGASVREQWRQGTKGLVVNPASGLCLVHASGAVPVMGSCAVKSAEQWKLPAQPMLAAEGGMCADDFHSLATPGSKVDLYSCNGTNGQTWNFQTDGTIRQSQYATACLTLHGTIKAGAKVTLYPCGTVSKGQHWTVSHESGLSSVVALGGVCLAIPSLRQQSGGTLIMTKCNKDNPLDLWHIQ